MDSTLASANELLANHATLTAEVRALQREHRKILSQLPSPPETLLNLPLLPSPPPSPPTSSTRSLEIHAPKPRAVRPDLPPAKRARVARYANYVPEEETIRNDYSQRYVDSGEWPQDWVLGAEPEKRFEEYPKQQRLLNLKKASVVDYAIAPIHVHQLDLPSLPPAKFDVILIDPPFSSSFSWDTLEQLPIPSLAADPSFVFLWVGSGAGEGLERGRAVLAKWGYRRCEDVVWIKTNRESNRGPGTDPPTTSLLTRTKQHCLMGIRGTVRRSTDSWFVHCNIDTDVIIWEGDPTDPTRKPPEMYTLIENFCLGLRRLEVFGRPYSLRQGWVTAGDFELTSEMMEETKARPWDPSIWEAELPRDGAGRALVPTSQEIEILRPKSPHRPGHNPSHSGSGSFNPNPNQGGQFTPGGLPSRPNMNMNNMNVNRNPNAAFSGGVGLGVVQPRPPPQMAMGQMNQPMGMQPFNPMMGQMNPMMMMGMPMMGFQPPMGMGGYGENMMFNSGGMMPDMGNQQLAMGGGPLMGMPGGPQMGMGGNPQMGMAGNLQMGMPQNAQMGMPGNNNMMPGNPQMGMFNPQMMPGGMNMMGHTDENQPWNGGWNGMQ